MKPSTPAPTAKPQQPANQDPAADKFRYVEAIPAPLRPTLTGPLEQPSGFKGRIERGNGVTRHTLT